MKHKKLRYRKKDQGFVIDAYTSFDFDQSIPTEKKYRFRYSIRIFNDTSLDAQVMFRHWQIWNALEEETYIEGPGIDGTTPIIEAGDFFIYHGFCALDTMTGTMKGRFDMVDTKIKTFSIETPAFHFSIPEGDQY